MLQLFKLQLLDMYFAEAPHAIGLAIIIHVCPAATDVIEYLTGHGMPYAVTKPIDLHGATNLGQLALELNVDIVFTTADLKNALEKIVDDELVKIVTTPEELLRSAETHSRGFEVPWSFEMPVKNQTWSNFYIMCEDSFRKLWATFERSRAAGAGTTDVMRALTQTLPFAARERDRVEFYRQQQRVMRRTKQERQDFRFEYGNALTSFYVTFWSGLDQLAAVLNVYLGLGLPDRDVGITYGNFLTKLAERAPAIHAIVTSDEFVDMYSNPKAARNLAAHRGSLIPQDFYSDSNDYSVEQLDVKAKELGYLDELQVLPVAMREHGLWTARERARRALLDENGVHLSHGIVICNKAGDPFYWYAWPRTDLDRMMALMFRIFEQLEPWTGFIGILRRRSSSIEATLRPLRRPTQANAIDRTRIGFVYASSRESTFVERRECKRDRGLRRIALHL